jgi:hypothetical protein
LSTKDIRTTHHHAMCDVCGRTLLRGERAEVYINGGARRSVCELCKLRALHEGWVLEGTMPAYQAADSGADRRRSIFGRRRSRREPGIEDGPEPEPDAGPAERAWPAPVAAAARPSRSGPREPRHVHAVPTSAEHRTHAAIDVFNLSEHRRTVAGVARSLGEPVVNVTPSELRASQVSIVVSWELCWYRYEVDLSDDPAAVRLAGQGYELEELDDYERLPTAVADDLGQLSLRR